MANGMLWLAVLILATFSNCCATDVTYGSVRNGAFNASRTLRADAPELSDLAKAQWKLPQDLVLPSDWGPNANTPGGTLEFVRQGGWKGSAFVRLDGGGHIASYFGRPEQGKPYVASLRVRGKGRAWFGCYEFGEDGQIGGAIFVERDIACDKWTEYRGVYPNKNPAVTGINLFLAGKGPVEVDEVAFIPADPIEVEMVREMVGLYGTGVLIEDPDVQAVKVDDACKSRLDEYDAARQELRRNQAKIDKAMLESAEKKAAALGPCLRGEGKMSVLADYYNGMVTLTRVMKRLAGETPVPTVAIKLEAVASGVGYKPGERAAKPNAVTVTDVRSNKVRYDENETATTVTTLVNATNATVQGTVVANMILGLDESREIARKSMTLNPGESKWSFAYSVGPETYGRAVEVEFLDATGKSLDRFQEYYVVAAEWFRVQHHAGAAWSKNFKTDSWVTYLNQSHWFAGEPTDFGVHADEFDEYLSPQAGYHMNMPYRKSLIAHYNNMGVRTTIYQNISYSGNMGYEVIRKHPEFALYDANGQFAVDPIYGGYPNPMEIASPIEIGPKRKVTKPYLDRKVTPWGHGIVNTANLDVIEYEANTVKEYSKHLGFNGVYVDGNLGVFSGYGHDGKPNVSTSDPVEFMKLNARNHRVFSEILKKDDPNFGTWYNWAYGYTDYMLAMGQKSYLGSGAKGDVGDDTLRAAAVNNSVFLMEIQDTFRKTESKWCSPRYHLQTLCDNRDHMMQKYGANMIIGYQFPWPEPEKPGANRWGWPTLNYFGAQLIATQQHFAGGFVPSMRPWLQFQTRYSRYLWAPDMKVVPNAEKLVSVSPPEELWWKRLVYTFKTDDGYDLIVHLIRIPPTDKWDVDWLDEPKPLTVSVRANLGKQKLRDVWAARPYDFEEEQQTVQSVLKPTMEKGNAVVKTPPFRYHTMIVFRVTAG